MHDDGGFLRKVLFLPPRGSSIASQVDWLHYTVIWTTMAGAFAITLVAAVFCIKYRQRRARARDERRERAPTLALWAEVLVISGLFTLFVVWWGVGFWQYVEMQEPPTGALDIYVSAKQWMWKFGYPDGSHTIDNLYVPANRPVRLIMTSRDVIHSFYVPDFRLKHDVVPGRYTSLWFTAKRPGQYQVLCAEYCGTEHSRMRASVVALSEADFGRWLNDSRRELVVSSIEGRAPERGTSLAASGEHVAARYGCLRCHTVDGSPHIGPTWAGLYGSLIPLRAGKSTIADVAYLTESMMDPQSKMHAGYDPVMPSYMGLLKPPEVGALVEYIKALQDVPVEGGPAVAAAPTGAPNRLPPSAPNRIPEPAGEPGAQAAALTSLPDAPRNDRAQGLPAAGAQIYPPPRQVTPAGLERQMLEKVQGATAQNGAQP